MTSAQWLWALPLLPAVAGGLLLLSGSRARQIAGPLIILVNAGVLALAVWAWLERPSLDLAWLSAGAETLHLQLSSEAEAAPLAILVAAVALLIVIYSQGYMARDEARTRLFGLMALFLGAMQLLVLAGDLLTILIAWELVGFCSYALIGFWHGEPERVHAGNRAFLTTRSADLGLYLAAMAAFASGRGLGFEGLPGLADPWRDVVAVGLIAAAAGKSAQLPFSGWLSGAMLGPSPVSALLHSATMVAAGVVLLVKALPLLEATGWALPAVLWIGVATALVAALIALAQDDLKQLLAASTASQYGYMFAAIGGGGAAAAATHLYEHAAMKAALFLVAGVLLHQGMQRFGEMGGLLRRLPMSATIFGAAALALAALPPFGGFFSKEAIMAEAKEASHAAFLLLMLVSFITALYAGRAWFGAFMGTPGSAAARRVEEPGTLLWLPALVLALVAVWLGTLLMTVLSSWWLGALRASPPPPVSTTDAIIAIGVIVAGALLAVVLHREHRLEHARDLMGARLGAVAERWLGAVRMLDLIGDLVIRLANTINRLERNEPAGRAGLTVVRFARAVGRVDTEGVDRVTAGASSRATQRLASLSQLADRRVWEGAISGLDQGLQAAAGGLSRMQTGLLHQYYALAAAGIALLFVYAFIVLRL